MTSGPPTATLRRLVEHPAFTGTIAVVIVLNAVVLGAQTYDELERRHGLLLDRLNDAFLGVFVVELTLRIASYGRRPQDFFRSGWNVFDFVVVGAAFMPLLRENATLLRLARLARIVRIVRLLPDLRVLLLAVGRSIPPLASMSVLTLLILFVYGMVGWTLFGEQDPERWDDVGTAMLNLFVMLSLENLPENLEAGMAIHPWSWVYFVSFAMVAAFIVLNVLIGVVLNSMEEARAIELDRERRRRQSEREAGEEPVESAVARRLADLRSALEDLEGELRADLHSRSRTDGRGGTRSARS
jgi:voltage-gated sodium channel